MGLVHTGKVAGVAAKRGSVTYSAASGAASVAGTIANYNAIIGAYNTAATANLSSISGVANVATTGDMIRDLNTAIGTATTSNTLAKAAADARTAANNYFAATGVKDTTAVTGLETVAIAKEKELAAAQATLAAISGTAAVDAVDAKTVFDNRLQINVDASAETSSGLTFGVRSRIRINENETGALSAPRVYVKSGAVEVAVGNIYGALDSMPGMYDSEVGLTALSDAGVVLNTVGKGYSGFDAYSSQGKGVNGIEAIYSAGGFTGHLSYSEPDLSGSAAVTNKHVAAVGAYTMGDWTVALGMQDSDNNAEDKTVLTVGGKVGDYGIGFAAADNDGVQKIALNGSATFGATTVNGFVADDESGTDTAYGLGVSYDLGGAAVVAGVERDAVGITRADMGVSFSF